MSGLRSAPTLAIVALTGLPTAAFTGLATAALSRHQPVHFTEIDVERINVVEPDGALRMVISNEARQHPGIRGGDSIPRETPRPPGILFFNHLGDEMGGLIFGGNGGVGHFGSLTFDRVLGDQTIGFRHLEGDDGAYSAGLSIWHQPRTTLAELDAERARLAAMSGPDRAEEIRRLREAGDWSAPRLFLGKGRREDALLELFDAQGRARLRIAVSATGDSSIEFLDEEGRVLQRLPG